MTCWSDLLTKLIMSPTVCHCVSHAVARLYAMFTLKKACTGAAAPEQKHAIHLLFVALPQPALLQHPRVHW